MAKIELTYITSGSQSVIGKAARVCYDSEGKSTRTDEELIRMLIRKDHVSPLEHAYATFHIDGCSRAMTHQLVRHRLASYSQRSQRYVPEEMFDFVTPKSIRDHAGWDNEFTADMNIIQDMYNKWRNRSIPKEDARFVLPNACTTSIMVSANFREWRYILSLRTSKHAQWEIREVCNEILNVLKDNAPACFDDIKME